MCFSWIFDIKILHHFSLVELNLFEDKSERKAGIFFLKTVFFQTMTPDKY